MGEFFYVKVSWRRRISTGEIPHAAAGNHGEVCDYCTAIKHTVAVDMKFPIHIHIYRCCPV